MLKLRSINGSSATNAGNRMPFASRDNTRCCRLTGMPK
jgi:hypothetical protein